MAKEKSSNAETSPVINIDAEIAAIRTLCNAQVKPKVKQILLEKLKEDHFEFKLTKVLFSRISEKVAKGKKLPELGPLLYSITTNEDVINIIESRGKRKVRTRESAADLVELLEKYRRLRSEAQIAKIIITKLKDETESNDKLADELSATILDMLEGTRSGTDTETLYTIGMDSEFDDEFIRSIIYAPKPRLIPTGIDAFDSENYGLPSRGMLTISANTGGFKSGTALNLAYNFYKQQNKSVCYISLEMKREEQVERLLSTITGIDYSAIVQKTLTLDQKKHLVKAWKRFHKHGKQNNCRFTILYPDDDLTVNQLFMLLRGGPKYDIIFVDYINLLRQDNAQDQQWRALDKIARKCFIYGITTGCLVVMLTQLSDDEKVKYSRAIVEHSTNFWKWFVGPRERETGIVQIKQDKARNQKLFPFYVKIDFAHMKIKDLTEEERQQISSYNKTKRNGEGGESIKTMSDDGFNAFDAFKEKRTRKVA